MVTAKSSAPGAACDPRPDSGEGRGRRPWLPALRIEHLWLSLPVLVIVCAGFLSPLRLYDFWWHLKAGEVIVAGRSIPDTEIFSFTTEGKPFIFQNWLMEVLYYGVYRLGGLPLVVAFNTGLLVAAFLPVYALCLAAAGRLRMGVITAFIAALPLVWFGNARSQVLSFVCFCIFYWVLTSYCERRRTALWVLPAVMMVWVNVHGAFVFGFALIVLFLLCEGALRLIRGAEPDVLSIGELRALLWTLCVTTVAMLANPHGYKIYSALAAVAFDPGSQDYGLEWQAPRADRVNMIILFGPFFLTLAVLIYARWRARLTHFVLFTAFALLAFAATRNTVWFGLVAAPILARYLAMVDAASFLRPLRRFALVESAVRRVECRVAAGSQAPIRYGLNALIAAVVLLIVLELSPWIRPHLHSERLGTSLLEAATPVAAMDFIESQHLHGNIFHPQRYGDYLIWRLWPEQRSFIDSRVHAFGVALVKDYLDVFNDSGWESRLARYDIRFLLLCKSDDAEGMMIETARAGGWRVRFEDEQAVLFERPGGSDQCTGRLP